MNKQTFKNNSTEKEGEIKEAFDITMSYKTQGFRGQFLKESRFRTLVTGKGQVLANAFM